jgi:hypothetical protein
MTWLTSNEHAMSVTPIVPRGRPRVAVFLQAKSEHGEHNPRVRHIITVYPWQQARAQAQGISIYLG